MTTYNYEKEKQYALWAVGIWAFFSIILEAALTSPQGFTFFDPIAAIPAAWGIWWVVKKKVNFLNRFTVSVIVAVFVKHAVCTLTGPGWTSLICIPITLAVAALTFNFLKLIKKPTRNEDRESPILDLKTEKYPVIFDDKATVFLPTVSQTQHTQIIGGSGSGKTVLMKRIDYQKMKQGCGMFIYDAKSNYAKTTAYYAKEVGRTSDFRLFDIGDVERSQTYNPLYGSNHDEVSNKMDIMLFPNREKENQHYYTIAKDVISNLTFLLLKEVTTVTFADYRQILSLEINDFRTLEYLCAKYPDTTQSKYFLENWVALNPDKRQERLTGLLSRLNNFCGKNWSNLINCRNPQIITKDVVDNNRIFVFATSVLANIEDAKSLSIAAILDFGPSIAKRMKNPPVVPFNFMLDEFYNITFKDFVETINKCREANMPCFLAHQSLGDLKSVSDTFCTQILDNTLNKVVLPVSSPETVDYFAKTFGTVRVMQQVFSYTAQGTVAGSTMKPDEHFRFDPNYLRSRDRGEAVVVSRWMRKDGKQETMAFEVKINREPLVPISFDINRVAPIRKLNLIETLPIQRKTDEPITSVNQISSLSPSGNYAKKSALVERLKKAVADENRKKVQVSDNDQSKEENNRPQNAGF